MAKSKTIEVQGVSIAIEQVQEEDYISLTDIAKKSDSESKHLIISWLKNTSTVQYLEA
jgi:DNA polymerase III delta subunit